MPWLPCNGSNPTRKYHSACLAMCRNVERMLDIFVNMNLEMQKTGNLSASISKEELLKLVTHCRAAC